MSDYLSATIVTLNTLNTLNIVILSEAADSLIVSRAVEGSAAPSIYTRSETLAKKEKRVEASRPPPVSFVLVAVAYS